MRSQARSWPISSACYKNFVFFQSEWPSYLQNPSETLIFVNLSCTRSSAALRIYIHYTSSCGLFHYKYFRSCGRKSYFFSRLIPSRLIPSRLIPSRLNPSRLIQHRWIQHRRYIADGFQADSFQTDRFRPDWFRTARYRVARERTPVLETIDTQPIDSEPIEFRAAWFRTDRFRTGWYRADPIDSAPIHSSIYSFTTLFLSSTIVFGFFAETHVFL